MRKKTLPYRGLESFLVVILLFSSSFAVHPAQAQEGSDNFQLIPGCDTDLAAAQAIYTSVTAALAQSRPNTAERLWRVYSICQKGSQGYAYVKSYSPSSGEPLPASSDRALVELEDTGWRTLLPEDGAEYNLLLATIPGLLSPEEAQKLLRQPLSTAYPLRYSGYALPWPVGQTAYAFRHWYPAIDFSIQTSGTVRNSKGGIALFVKDSSTRLCGDPPPDWSCWQWANTIVIQSGPNEYVWYMHFAPYTIPDWIQEGVYVPAGTDLGQQGSTGWASGPHVHFMVASAYSCCVGSGDSRIPDWPYLTTPVDFIEYTWESIPWQSVSQNGQAGAPAIAPPPPTISSDPSPTITTIAMVTQSGCPSPYTVQPGEWVYRIASKCGVAVAALVAANPGFNPDYVFPGQQLNMPGGANSKVLASPVSTGSCSGTHVVAGGENLFRISYNCGLTTEQLANANGIFYPYNIYPGQVLHFP